MKFSKKQRSVWAEMILSRPVILIVYGSVFVYIYVYEDNLEKR